MGDIVGFLREAKVRFGRYWRKSARVAGAELAGIAVGRLEKLNLIERRIDGNGDVVHALPALARFALGDAEVRSPGGKRAAAQRSHDAELELT
jgi:hypothetical protein